jgi:hypothetical protein
MVNLLPAAAESPASARSTLPPVFAAAAANPRIEIIRRVDGMRVID